MGAILDLLNQKKYRDIRLAFMAMKKMDIAAAFEEIPRDEALVIFRLLPKDRAAEVFAYMSPDCQQMIIESVSDREIQALMSELFIDDATDFIEDMPANVVKRVLSNTDEDTRRLINEFLKFPEDSAGSIMTNELVDLDASLTVEQAFDHIRKTGVDKETILICYVIDDNRRLQGFVSAQRLLLASPDDVISDIMEKNPLYVHVGDDREAVAGYFSKYDLLAIPVVDQEECLVGIITIDDILDVIQEETTEDFEKMAAITPIDDTYLKTSPFTHARKRVPWLLILMLSAAITGTIISSYEEAFAIMPVLVAFIPMLMDTGGNCGSQASTLIIRGMALDEIKGRDVLKVLWKEVQVSVMVGLGLAVVNTVRIYLTNKSLPLAITVSLSLFTTVCISKVIGCMLPMGAKKLKLDPALMASPVITTVVDALSVLVYFNLAKFILKI